MASSPALTRFHLHIRGPDTEILDPEGSVHPDLRSVRAAMIASARDMLAHDLLEGRPLDLRCRIDAESDQVIVATLAWQDALEILSDGPQLNDI
ncbi:DUF6894 family protein [Brevundimonas variabilis]|uniref:DUF6894 family protein n=1 Tax=Brevundimonas variabilis TaxID=74312 RepID=UPI003CCC932D